MGWFFSQILNDIVPYAQDFLPVEFYSNYFLNKLCFQLLQNVMWTVEQRTRLA